MSLVLVVVTHGGAAQGSIAGPTASFTDCLDQIYPGGAQNDVAGSSLAYVGDITGDGLPDLAIGAPQARLAGANSGAVFVMSATTPRSVAAAPLTLVGEDASDLAGTSVAAAGDVNGDGFQDLLVGAPLSDRAAIGAHYGAAYLFYGPLVGTVSLSDADAIIENPDWGRLGHSLAGVGDVDGDGYDDILVGAPTTDSFGVDGSGAAYLFRGPLSGVVPTSAATAHFYGQTVRDNIGFTVAPVGDLNQDGFPDLGIGSVLADHAGTHSGALYIFHGGPGLAGSHSVLNADHRIVGEGPDEWFSYAIATPGDVTGDGVDDLVVSSIFENTGGYDAGRVYVFAGPVTATSANQATAKINGAAEYDEFGTALAGVGDLNGDGYTDLAVGASRGDGAQRDVGGIYVFSGGPTLSGIMTTSHAPVQIFGDSQGDVVGRAIVGGHDFTGDGELDIAFGAIGRDIPLSNNGALVLTDWTELTTDGDGDGLTDLCEMGPYGTDPANPDTDGEGLSDGEEVLVWHTDPLDADTDGDLYSDAREVQEGSDPNRWLSVPGPAGPVNVPLIQGSRNSVTDGAPPVFT